MGKSSLINALAGKGKAKTSAESGYTKGFQKVRVDNKIVVLDTPGVFPKEKDKMTNVKIGAVDYGKVKDPETAALQLIEENSKKIKAYYKVKGIDGEDILEAIGLKKKKLLKGGKIDTHAAARLLIKEWQEGKI